MTHKYFSSIIENILNVIEYDGDRKQHATQLLEKLYGEIEETMKNFFARYLLALEPTLTEEQKQRLKEYFENLQKEAAKEQ